MDITGKIKIIDFGLCADLESGLKDNMVGSAFWVPPEMIRGIPHGLPADIWSFAVCILELYLQNPPHYKSTLKCMYSACTIGLTSEIPHEATSEARDFLKKCLIQDPRKRATCHQLLEHQWVNQHGLDKGITDILKTIFLSNSLTAVL
eukprot:TRINITY_DN11822_c0_g1_i1.p1 TRINITY_DN11822_c0_g1~~TRINITY_DN11822_c0_g1_i1.p1  ORF type:complete len:148 (-),score=16.84 TRINITY_DN11822_c0_g1_i1:33-476(-)